MKDSFIFGHPGFERSRALRVEVFCNEQGVQVDREIDEHEDTAWHFVTEDENGVVATGRLFCLGDGVWKLGRIAVKKNMRKTGLGARVVENLIAKARELGAKLLKISAQTHAIGFYERFGFALCSVEYLDENLPSVDMEKNLVFDGCEWVGFEEDSEAVFAKKTFTLDSTENISLIYCGLGFTHITVNGKRIDDSLLSPAWTNYEKRDLSKVHMPIFDTLTHRIYYIERDISQFAVKGENTVEFHIGGGWYRQHESPNEGMTYYGQLKLCFKVTDLFGAVCVSDSDVLWKNSYVTYTNIYYGEKHDGRLIESNDWKNARVIPAPVSVLNKQTCPDDREIRSIVPKCIHRFGDCAIYDLGENVAGYPKIRFSENSLKNEKILVRYAEELNADGSLNFFSAGGSFRMQTDEYIHSDKHKEHLYYPLFTWHAGRYFEVIGNAEIVEFAVVHTDIKRICSYKSDDDMLNWIVETYLRTQANNIHCCVPSDCPHRERLGYTGDGQLTCGTVMDCFDAKEMYLKWMQDIADSQDVFGGHVQHTAPFYGGGGGPGGWGGAIVFVPYQFYLHYGDKSVLEKYYPNMLKYLLYMETHSEGGLVVRSEKGGWCLGDWCTPEKIEIPEEYVNTYFYIKAVQTIVKIEKLLGIDNTEQMQQKQAVASKAIKDKYFNDNTGSFFEGKQGADAFAVDIGIDDGRAYDNLVKKYSKLKKFDTGIFGTEILVRILCEHGYTALAKALLTSKEGIGTFSFMREHGATTLWEDWDGAYSHSHPMFGAVVSSIIKYLN